MKETTFSGKTARRSRTLSQPETPAGQEAISMAPPEYGIDFVDRDLAAGAQAALQLKPDLQPVGLGGGPVSPEVESAIQRARGGGQPLDGVVQAQMSEALGHDFSGVRVHTDGEADDLNQQLMAKAFTTGHDIFFSRGEYNPGTGRGRELIAHELTHVVQQGTGRVRGSGSGMTVRPAGDAFEQEADRVAEAATRSTSKSVQEQTTQAQYEEPDLLALQRAVANPDIAGHAGVLALQQTVDHWAVQRSLAARESHAPVGHDEHSTTGAKASRSRRRWVYGRAAQPWFQSVSIRPGPHRRGFDSVQRNGIKEVSPYTLKTQEEIVEDYIRDKKVPWVALVDLYVSVTETGEDSWVDIVDERARAMAKTGETPRFTVYTGTHGNLGGYALDEQGMIHESYKASKHTAEDIGRAKAKIEAIYNSTVGTRGGPIQVQITVVDIFTGIATTYRPIGRTRKGDPRFGPWVVNYRVDEETRVGLTIPENLRNDAKASISAGEVVILAWCFSIAAFKKLEGQLQQVIGFGHPITSDEVAEVTKHKTEPIRALVKKILGEVSEYKRPVTRPT